MKTRTKVRTKIFLAVGSGRVAFTVVELLVVMAVVAILIALLLPAVNTMRARAESAACQQNLRKIGLGMIQYSSDNKGFFPPHWGGNPNFVWYGHVAPYIVDFDGDVTTPMADVFFCPSTPVSSRKGKTYTSTYDNGVGQSYGYNYYFLTHNFAHQTTRRNQALKEPSKVVLVDDIPEVGSTEVGVPLPSFCGNYLQYPAAAELSERHPGESCNVVFADGHVENRNTRQFVTPGEDFDYFNWAPQ